MVKKIFVVSPKGVYTQFKKRSKAERDMKMSRKMGLKGLRIVELDDKSPTLKKIGRGFYIRRYK